MQETANKQKHMADEMDINLEVFNLETDFFGDLHCTPASQTCSVMPKPNTGTIPSWMSAPCGGCGRRKGENELLDDMDSDKYGKVKCREIEEMLPKLMKMVEGEIESMIHGE